MNRSKSISHTNRAFTLIELLVVIGIIAILAAGIGVALRGNNPDASLRGAQGLISGVLSGARGQAALTQSNARIIVQADSTRDDFLRSIRVVIPDPANTAQWKQVGAEVILPPNVYVVPHINTLTGVTFDSTNGTWNVGRYSTFLRAATAADVAGLVNASASTILVSRDITALGTVDGSGRIVVTPGRASGATSVVLDNASAVRGLSVSRYGVATLVNEAESFDQITN